MLIIMMHSAINLAAVLIQLMLAIKYYFVSPVRRAKPALLRGLPADAEYHVRPHAQGLPRVLARHLWGLLPHRGGLDRWVLLPDRGCWAGGGTLVNL